MFKNKSSSISLTDSVDCILPFNKCKADIWRNLNVNMADTLSNMKLPLTHSITRYRWRNLDRNITTALSMVQLEVACNAGQRRLRSSNVDQRQLRYQDCITPNFGQGEENSQCGVDTPHVDPPPSVETRTSSCLPRFLRSKRHLPKGENRFFGGFLNNNQGQPKRFHLRSGEDLMDFSIRKIRWPKWKKQDRSQPCPDPSPAAEERAGYLEQLNQPKDGYEEPTRGEASPTGQSMVSFCEPDTARNVERQGLTNPQLLERGLAQLADLDQQDDYRAYLLHQTRSRSSSIRRECWIQLDSFFDVLEWKNSCFKDDGSRTDIPPLDPSDELLPSQEVPSSEITTSELRSSDATSDGARRSTAGGGVGETSRLNSDSISDDPSDFRGQSCSTSPRGMPVLEEQTTSDALSTNGYQADPNRPPTSISQDKRDLEHPLHLIQQSPGQRFLSSEEERCEGSKFKPTNLQFVEIQRQPRGTARRSMPVVVEQSTSAVSSTDNPDNLKNHTGNRDLLEQSIHALKSASGHRCLSVRDGKRVSQIFKPEYHYTSKPKRQSRSRTRRGEKIAVSRCAYDSWLKDNVQYDPKDQTVRVSQAPHDSNNLNLAQKLLDRELVPRRHNEFIGKTNSMRVKSEHPYSTFPKEVPRGMGPRGKSEELDQSTTDQSSTDGLRADFQFLSSHQGKRTFEQTSGLRSTPDHKFLTLPNLRRFPVSSKVQKPLPFNPDQKQPRGRYRRDRPAEVNQVKSDLRPQVDYGNYLIQQADAYQGIQTQGKSHGRSSSPVHKYLTLPDLRRFPKNLKNKQPPTFNSQKGESQNTYRPDKPAEIQQSISDLRSTDEPPSDSVFQQTDLCQERRNHRSTRGLSLPPSHQFLTFPDLKRFPKSGKVQQEPYINHDKGQPRSRHRRGKPAEVEQSTSDLRASDDLRCDTEFQTSSVSRGRRDRELFIGMTSAPLPPFQRLENGRPTTGNSRTGYRQTLIPNDEQLRTTIYRDKVAEIDRSKFHSQSTGASNLQKMNTRREERDSEQSMDPESSPGHRFLTLPDGGRVRFSRSLKAERSNFISSNEIQSRSRSHRSEPAKVHHASSDSWSTDDLRGQDPKGQTTELCREMCGRECAAFEPDPNLSSRLESGQDEKQILRSFQSDNHQSYGFGKSLRSKTLRVGPTEVDPPTSEYSSTGDPQRDPKFRTNEISQRRIDLGSSVLSRVLSPEHRFQSVQDADCLWDSHPSPMRRDSRTRVSFADLDSDNTKWVSKIKTLVKIGESRRAADYGKLQKEDGKISMQIKQNTFMKWKKRLHKRTDSGVTESQSFTTATSDTSRSVIEAMFEKLISFTTIKKNHAVNTSSSPCSTSSIMIATTEDSTQ